MRHSWRLGFALAIFLWTHGLFVSVSLAEVRIHYAAHCLNKKPAQQNFRLEIFDDQLAQAAYGAFAQVRPLGRGEEGPEGAGTCGQLYLSANAIHINFGFL